MDTEELRADKAVKVSRKEFNDMLAELFEHANNFEKNQANLPKIDVNTEIQPQVNLLLDVTVLVSIRVLRWKRLFFMLH